jgi:hypothetical protein
MHTRRNVERRQGCPYSIACGETIGTEPIGLLTMTSSAAAYAAIVLLAVLDCSQSASGVGQSMGKPIALIPAGLYGIFDPSLADTPPGERAWMSFSAVDPSPRWRGRASMAAGLSALAEIKGSQEDYCARSPRKALTTFDLWSVVAISDAGYPKNPTSPGCAAKPRYLSMPNMSSSVLSNE